MHAHRSPSAGPSVVTQLRQAIAVDRAYKPGDRLPNREALAESFDVLPSTVSKALVQLREEGYVVRSGVVWYVSDPRSWPDVRT